VSPPGDVDVPECPRDVPTERNVTAVADLASLQQAFDVDDPAFIADPYPTLDAIRETTPIYWNEATRQWIVTRFADVHATLRDRRLGRAYTHVFSHADVGRAEPDPRWASFHEHESWSLLCLEPPDHTRLRRLITKVFTPSAVAALQPRIEATSNRLLDDCAERGSFDLLADYAQPFSVAVICSMLGVPVADMQRLLDWSHAIVKMYELSASDETKATANRAAAEYIEYTRDLIAAKRRHPDDLLVSALVQVEDAGDTLTEAEIVSTTMVLVEAGHEATVNTLGNGFRALMHHRDEWQRLVAGEVGAAAAVEELLRWDAPLQLFERWALEPGVEVAGQPIAVGDEVAMLFGSAQRDPRRFADPDRFDIGRNDPAHIGFGGGIHFCIGAPLARAELTQSVSGLAARFPDLALAAEPVYQPTFVIRGLTGLLLTSGR
jgi:cytochrome P450